MRPAADSSGLLDTTVEIETPEHVRFRYEVAGPAPRAMAYLVDLLARLAVVAAAVPLLVALGLSLPAPLANAGWGLALLVLFVLEWVYFVALEVVTGGQSLGKLALGLRVVHDDGTAVDAGDSVLRNLLRAADFLPAAYALGVVVMGRDHAFRRLGDLVAGTLVVRERKGALAAPLDVGSLPARRFDGPLDLSHEELEVLELFARRRGTLSRPRLQELAAPLAARLAARLALTYDDPAELLLALYRGAVEGRA